MNIVQNIEHCYATLDEPDAVFPVDQRNKMEASGYSRLALGALPSSVHQKKPIHGLQLFLAAVVW